MRNSRSSSFEILLRFEIGRKFEGSDLSRPGFLIKGLTIACLKIAGKQPSAKDKFANVQISSEKTSEHDFRSDVGMKSSLHDLLGMLVNNFRTSAGVTSGMLSNCGPV